MILVPTRELARQVLQAIKQVSHYSKISSTAVLGGEQYRLLFQDFLLLPLLPPASLLPPPLLLLLLLPPPLLPLPPPLLLLPLLLLLLRVYGVS